MHHNLSSLLSPTFKSAWALQGAQSQSKEEAIRSMQSYRAGLTQALAKHEDQLKAQASPSEGDKVRLAFLLCLSAKIIAAAKAQGLGQQGCVLA